MTPARLGVLFVLLSFGTASAEEPLPRGLGHDANPVHWYEMGCCNKQDCEPVEPGAITAVPEGYRVHYLTSRGFVVDGIVTFKSGAVRPSRDQREHACASPARPLCVYLPFGS